MDRKAWRAARERAFNRRPGRRRGPLPLCKDKRRFEAAMFHMLTQTRLRGKAAKAAALAASILHEKTIPMLIVEDERIGIGFSFEGGRGERIFARENRGWKIAREAPA